LIYPDSFEDKIGFAQVRRKVSELCDTPVGQELVESLKPSTDLDAIGRALDESQEFVEILANYTDFPDLASVDVRKSIRKGMIEGTYLDIPEWLDLRSLLQSTRHVYQYFEKKPAGLFPRLRDKIRQINLYPFIQERMDQVFSKQGQVRDQASPELKRIRNQLSEMQASIGRRMESVIRQACSEGWIENDTQASIRDGRLVIPVPVTNKRRIRGYIHDESATGKTAFVEPIELVELNNALRELEIAEHREIIRILIDLTATLRPYFGDMENWNFLTGFLDFTRAKARISRMWEGKRVSLQPVPVINWTGARHPLLDLAYRAVKRKVVPQDIRLDTHQRILLISGPNAGGKSVCLKAVGLNQYLVQTGFLIPVEEGSESGIFTRFLLDIGDEQSLEDDLSTYSSHLQHMKYFLRQAEAGTLLMIDEFGAGTEPQLGGAIAEAILGRLAQSGAFGMITTHYTNLKHFAASAEGVVNAAMRYDVQKMVPLFELETGKPGSSFALEIARNIGLPEEVVEEASGLIGEKQVRFDKHLREISRDKRYWENKRQKIRLASNEVDRLLEQYTAILSQTEKERKKILTETRQLAEAMMADINRKIEKAVREIRESQADKEKVKIVRRDLEGMRDTVEKAIGESISEGDQKIDRVKKEKTRISSKLDLDKTPDPGEALTLPGVPMWIPGQKIRIRDREIFGEIIEARGESLLVSMGQMLTTLRADQVEAISSAEFERATGKPAGGASSFGFDLEQRKLSFTPNLDIRGLRGDEALQKVTEFIDEAIMVGSTELRILHGKGDGILRHLVRELLSGIDVVSKFEDEDIRFGGTGITLVRLSF